MPKLKPNKSAVKRFRISARGKVSFRRAGKRHLLSSKTSKRRRHLRRERTFHTFNEEIARRLLTDEARPSVRRETTEPAPRRAPRSPRR